MAAPAAERVAAQRARVRWKPVAAVVLLVLGLVTIGLAAPVIWLAIDEAAVPPASDAPSFPEGVTASHQGVAVDQGVLARINVERVAFAVGTELADTLDTSAEDCSARSLLDRRRVCAWLDVVDGEAHLFLTFDRPLEQPSRSGP